VFNVLVLSKLDGIRLFKLTFVGNLMVVVACNRVVKFGENAHSIVDRLIN